MSSMYPFGGAVARSCMRCGNPLGAKESQCSRCGTYNPLPQGQQFGMPQQGGAQGAPGPGWGQAPQFPQGGNNAAWPGAMGPSNSGQGSTGQGGSAWPQQNNLFGGQNSPQQNNLFGGQNFPQQNMFTPPQNNGFGEQNQSSFNNSFSAFPQNPNQSSSNSFFNATQQQNGLGASSWQSINNQAKPAWMKGQDDEEKKKGKNKAVAAIVIVLVIALIGGGSFGIYKVLKSNGNSNQPAATTPAIATPTGTPLFRETFQNNNAGWDTTPPTGAKLTLANNGKLVMESDNNELYRELLPGGKTYSDFRLDVDAGLTSGDPNNGYGVYIRGASTQDSVIGLYYRFEIYGDGSFVVYKGAQNATSGKLEDDPLTSVNAPPNKAINPKGQMNHLTIIAKGSSLEFLVNGVAVTSFTDNSYKSGTIAFFVSNLPKSPPIAQATFANLAIFPVQ